MTSDIIRDIPPKKILINYPKRYPESAFKELKKMLENELFESDYVKWKSGINPITNRKIKINGKVHAEIKNKFMINFMHSHRDGHSCGESIIFEQLKNIDSEEYIKETDVINLEVDKENKKIMEYNRNVSDVVQQIETLENWNDYIMFEGKKYGTNIKVKNSIHIENNCGGNVVFSHKEKEYIFNDRPFCNYDDKEIEYSHYKCKKCNYEYRHINKTVGGGNGYVSKMGFWWK